MFNGSNFKTFYQNNQNSSPLTHFFNFDMSNCVKLRLCKFWQFSIIKKNIFVKLQNIVYFWFRFFISCAHQNSKINTFYDRKNTIITWSLFLHIFLWQNTSKIVENSFLSSNLLFYCLDTKRLFSRFLRKNIGPIKGKSQENLFIFNYQTLPGKKFPASVRFST